MKISSHQPHIIVVGSSSVDLVINTEKLPQANETILARKSESFFGGKGANQAVATARLGANVYFVGSVGMDPMGQQILRHLLEENINVAFVSETENCPTGTAYVTAASGENSIVVVPAANYEVAPHKIELADKFFQTADLVLVQLEIPMEAVLKAFELAEKYQKKVGIYAAPAIALPEKVINYAAFIVAKQKDLQVLFGESRGMEELLQQFPNKLFVRDDRNTTIYFDGSEIRYVAKDILDNFHKMGMGDAFISGFSIALCHKNTIEEAVEFGNEIAYRCSEKRGSQTNLPYLKDYL